MKKELGLVFIFDFLSELEGYLQQLRRKLTVIDPFAGKETESLITAIRNWRSTMQPHLDDEE